MDMMEALDWRNHDRSNQHARTNFQLWVLDVLIHLPAVMRLNVMIIFLEVRIDWNGVVRSYDGANVVELGGVV